VAVWALSGYCPKNVEMYLFGLYLAASVGGFVDIFVMGVFASDVPERARGGVFTAVSGSHVTHTCAVRLQVLSRMVCGCFCTARTAFLKTFLCECWGVRSDVSAVCVLGGGYGGVEWGDRMK
jgi:hypothetical protein